MCFPSKPIVYVSGHNPEQAKALADRLRASDYEVASTWHDEAGPKVDTSDRTTWDDRWQQSKEQIEKANVFVMLASPDKVPGGKFVELGFALGRAADPDSDGKFVAVIGEKPENGMAANLEVSYFRDEESFLAYI